MLAPTGSGLALAVVLLAWPASAAEPPALLLGRGEQLARVKERLAAGDRALTTAWQKLRSRADAALESPLTVVTDKTLLPPSNDRHDYLSLGPYWWPNPAQPDGLPYVWRDGEENPARRDSDVTRLDAMAASVTALGTAWYFTEDKRYAENAARRLRAWFLDPATRMNPNFRFAQMRRGHGVTNFAGMIEAGRLRWLVDAAILLEGSPAWPAKDAAALRRWFGELAGWMVHSPEGREEGMAPNNHGSWHDVHVVLFSLYAGREDLARPILDQAPRRIFTQIFLDGRQPYELIRTRSLHYSDFNNRALVELARLGRRLGYDLFAYRSSDGRSIRLGLEYLRPFLLGEKPWPAPQIKPLSYGGIAETHWRAAVGFGEPQFAAVVRRLPGGALPDPVVQLLDPLPDSF